MSKEDIRKGLKGLFQRPGHKNLIPWLIERVVHYAFIGVIAALTKEWFAVLVIAGIATFLYVYEFVAKGR